MDPRQFMLEQGLNPQFLAMEGSRILDEKRHRGELVDDDLHHETDHGLFDLGPLPGSIAAPAVVASLGPLVLVDDDIGTREFAQQALTAHGFQVDAFAGSEEALIRIDTLYRDGGRPRVVVDLIMPRMDGSGILGGLELLDLLHGNFADLPVLVMSDYHNIEAERRIRELGYDFMLKPRRSEIPDPQVADVFRQRLAEEMARAPGSPQPALASNGINLGDELRLEFGEVVDQSSVPAPQSTGITLLRGMLEELSDPSLGGGITLLVLRFASEFMNRAVIFSVKDDEIVGLGQFGLNLPTGTADNNIRNLRIPCFGESLFSDVLATSQPLKVSPMPNRWDEQLLDQLGGVPREIFLGPLISEGEVVAILYGDNMPDNRPIGDTDSLEIFLSQAGMAMERALLQSRLKGTVSEEI